MGKKGAKLGIVVAGHGHGLRLTAKGEAFRPSIGPNPQSKFF